MRNVLMILALAAIGLSAAPVHAQICGDADGSGTVTITDGVQVLAAAAGLTSVCSSAVCDVDGSGSVTITDGVNVLRLAAALPVTVNCSGINNQIETLITQIQPFLGIGLGFIPRGAQAAQQSADCDNVGQGFIFFGETAITLQNCLLGGGLFDGGIVIGQNSVGFDNFTFVDQKTGEFSAINGSLSFTENGSSSIVNGGLSISSQFGSFAFNFDGITINQQGLITAGTASFSGADIDGVTGIALTYSGSPLVNVAVSLDDGGLQQFLYDTQTGALTPA